MRTRIPAALGAVLVSLTMQQAAFSQTPKQDVPAAAGQGKDNERAQREQFDQFRQEKVDGAAQDQALIDLTGYWVAVVTEDWRWRMLTPPKGDYASVPLNPTGKQVADTWTPSLDGSCKAYGAAALMRMPTRLHITWASPNQLKVETDWGEQTRLFHFSANEALVTAAPSIQGVSIANWEKPVPLNGPGGGFGALPPVPAPGGSLKVVTSNLTPGWLRRNGVPYSEDTKVTEYFQTFKDPIGRDWFDVTTIVEDPQYLLRSFVTSSEYRKEPDGSKWSPHPCKG